MFGYKPNTLSRGVKKVLSEHAVGSSEPDLAFDFIDNEYTTVGGTKGIASAVTHSRSGNATMTDGYGPELVANGGFDSDTGWTKGTGWSISGGVASIDGSQTGISDLEQPITFASGKSYVVELTVTRTAGVLYPKVGDTTGTGISASGSFTQYIAAGSGANLELRADVNFAGTIDNISVREMPVLKWAPHNLLTYSEDFSNAAWTDGAISNGSRSGADLSVSDAEGYAYVQQLITATTSIPHTIEVEVTCDTAVVDVPLRAGLGTGNDSNLVTFSAGETKTVSFSVTPSSGTLTIGLDARNAVVPGGSNATGYTITLNKARAYRSDLGGMVDNPERGDSYVPTTSAAAYLPRIGHHEYNGYEWVNKGLLAESESRTNLITYSEDVTDAAWSKVSISVTADTAASPAGSQTADTLTVLATGGYRYVHQQVSLTQNETYTFSVYLKYTDTQWVWLLGETFGDTFFWFDIQNGVLGGSGGGTGNPKVGQNYSHAIEDAGNGWYRCSATFTKTSGTASEQIGFGLADADSTPQATLNQTCLSWGAQLETGSVPSSYVPTSGATATRAAETFTVPAANLPWPQPEYIGPELVTNGGFDTDTDWTKGTGWTISGGEAVGSSAATLSQPASTTSGTPYLFKFTVSNYSAGTITPNISGRSGPAFTGNGTFEAVLVAAGGAAFNLLGGGGFTGTVDNISVREINPLSVSIAMKGEMDYADTGDTELTWYYWFASSGNYVQSNLRAQSTATGELYTLQAADSVADDADGRYSQYAPGLNVPFDIAARHGSTFVNGAAGGVALTADTTPTALADLSSTDLSLAHDYMGTISEFRVWDKDLGDSGIEEATEPSTEPTLSLTFDGQSLSFTDTGWTP